DRKPDHHAVRRGARRGAGRAKRDGGWGPRRLRRRGGGQRPPWDRASPAAGAAAPGHRPGGLPGGVAPVAAAGPPPPPARPALRPAPPGPVGVGHPMQSKLVTVAVADGDQARPGQPVAIVEAMKMEIVVAADDGGVVRAVAARPGDILMPGDPIVFLEPAE